MSPLEKICLKVLKRFAFPDMTTRQVRHAARVFTGDESLNNERVLKALKRLRGNGYVVSERIDHQLHWELLP